MRDFRRKAKVKLNQFRYLYARTASLTGEVNDAGVDVDGDALLDRVDITLGVDVQRAGGYAVSVLLRASNDREVWTRGGYAELTTASKAITTHVSAEDLKEKLGVNGHYDLKTVRLLWSPDGPNAIAKHIASELLDLGSTDAYEITELDRPYLLFTNYLGDEGVDVNGNGQFDFIRATFEIDSAIPDPYRFEWNAKLIPQSGLPSEGIPSFAKNSGVLTSGKNILTLDFPVEEYGLNNISGPFLVTESALYPAQDLPSPYGNAPGDKFQELPSQLGITKAYRASELEGGGSNTRLLVADVDLAVETYDYTSLPGNKILIEASFKNVTDNLSFQQPFFFTVNADTNNIVSSLEPEVSNEDLGGDGILSPGEVTSVLTFEVTHNGQPFTYLTDAYASVQELAPLGSQDPSNQASNYLDHARTASSSVLKLKGVISEGTLQLELIDKE